jgi:HD-GYP domain-containing protein (c-di-GMP phosphodiesterase class II)
MEYVGAEYLGAAEQKLGSGVAQLVDRSLLGRLQDAVARSARLSLSVCDVDGSIVTQSLLGRSDLHALAMNDATLTSQLLARAHQRVLRGSDGDMIVKVPVAGEARMLVYPLHIEEMLFGIVAAGPIWPHAPTSQQLKDFRASCGVRRATMNGASVLSERALREVRQDIANLGQLVIGQCQERLIHDRSITTLATLHKIGQAVNSQLDLREVLEEVLDSAIRFLGAENGSLMLLNESRSELRILVARGLSQDIVETTRIKMGEGVSGRVAQEGRSLLLPSGLRKGAGGSAPPGREMKTAMSVPLTVRDEVIGVLNIRGRLAGGDFSEGDLSMLGVVASHAAGAIANAQSYESAKRKAYEMSALFAIGTALNSELERNQVLQKVLDHAIELLGSKKGSIMLLNDDTEELNIEVAVGLPEEIISSVRLRLGEGIAGKVAREGKPRLLLKGVAEKDSLSGRRATEMPAAMCVPLGVRDKLIGVINISEKLDGGNFTEEHLRLMVMLANQAAIAIENAKLHDELQELFVSSITALANAIDARDPYTRGHSERVAVYSVRIGERMGLAGKELDYLRYAALLHDVGKINIRDEILNKPGRLTDEEFQIMKKHPEYGAAIMMPVKAFQKIIPFMFYHHEKFCALGGYPVGLKGEEIPLEARMISVADSYDAMTSHRPYRRALGIDQAVTELLKNAGTQFDPRIVEVFTKLLEEDPEFARTGIRASLRAEKEGWARESQVALVRAARSPVSPRARIPSVG